MPHSDAWHARRKLQFGSSDVAAIMGLHPFKTAADVIAEKAFDTRKVEVENDAIKIGNWLEPHLIQSLVEIEEDTILTEDSVCFAVSDDDPILAAEPDGVFVKKDDQLAEAKSTGIVGPVFGRWGDAGTDQVPDWVVIQCQVQMYVHKREAVKIGAAIGRRRPFPVPFVVRREDRIIELCLKVAHEMWETYVNEKILPTDKPASIEVIKAIQRQPNKVIILPAHLVQQREALNAVKKAAVDEFDVADRAMKGALGDAEIGVYETPDGPKAVSFFEGDVAGYTVEPRKQRCVTVARKALPDWVSGLLDAPQPEEEREEDADKDSEEEDGQQEQG